MKKINKKEKIMEEVKEEKKTKKKEKKLKKFFDDYKKFASKGNIVDLAIAVVVGTAFTKIVNSLVQNIIMPLISLVTGKEGFTEWKWVLVPATEDATEVAISYGIFLQAILDFLIVSFVIFLVLRIIKSSKEKLEKITKDISEDLRKKSNKENELIANEVKNEIEKITENEKNETPVIEKEDRSGRTEEEIRLLREIKDLLSANIKGKND